MICKVAFKSSNPADALLIKAIIPSGETPFCKSFLFKGAIPVPGMMFSAFPPIKELSAT